MIFSNNVYFLTYFSKYFFGKKKKFGHEKAKESISYFDIISNWGIIIKLVLVHDHQTQYDTNNKFSKQFWQQL